MKENNRKERAATAAVPRYRHARKGIVLEGGKATLLGTDDPGGLLAFLRDRTGAEVTSSG